MCSSDLALGLETAPLQIAVAALPMIAEEERVGREGRFPPKHDASQRPGRAGHDNAETGGRSGKFHGCLARRKTRALPAGRHGARAVVIDEDTGRKPRQFGDHGRARGRTRCDGLSAAAQGCANQERASTEFEGVAEEGTAAGFVCSRWHGDY